MRTRPSKPSLREQSWITALNSASPRPHLPGRKPRFRKSYCSPGVGRVGCGLLPAGPSLAFKTHPRGWTPGSHWTEGDIKTWRDKQGHLQEGQGWGAQSGGNLEEAERGGSWVASGAEHGDRVWRGQGPCSVLQSTSRAEPASSRDRSPPHPGQAGKTGENWGANRVTPKIAWHNNVVEGGSEVGRFQELAVVPEMPFSRALSTDKWDVGAKAWEQLKCLLAGNLNSPLHTYVNSLGKKI